MLLYSYRCFHVYAAFPPPPVVNLPAVFVELKFKLEEKHQTQQINTTLLIHNREMSIESLLFDCTQCESWRSAVSHSLVFLLCPLMGISRSELSHSWTRADLMLCFLIFLCFSKCLHISIYFCSSITLLVLFSRAVFFFLGWLLFYCMPPTTSCLSEEQKQWDCMSQSLCGLHHDWLFYCLAALASIHAQLNPPTVLCSASIHYKQQRLPCAALFIKDD